MSLQLTVDTLDSVPETFRSLYTEKDGRFALQVEGIEDTGGLKKALETERKNAREAQRLAKQYDGLGLTADEIKALVEEKRQSEDKKLKDQGNFEAILKQKETEWSKQLETERAARTAAERSEQKAVLGTSLMSALTKLGATEEGIDLLPDRLGARIRYEMNGDSRVIRILSVDGETPMAGSAKDGFATFDDLVKEAAGKWPSLFKSNSPGGGGKPPGSTGGTGGKTITRSAFNALSLDEQGATIKGGTRVVD